MTDLTNWHGVPAPERVAIDGRYVRLEPLNADKHGDPFVRGRLWA